MTSDYNYERRENGLLFVDDNDAVLDLTLLPEYNNDPLLSRIYGTAFAKQEQVDANTFNFTIEVTPKYRVRSVRFEGNVKEKTSRLEKEIKTVFSEQIEHY